MSTALVVGSLFAGVGGFDLAARWMGWRTAWFSEINPYASRVLARHWPGVPNHGDITGIDFRRVEPVDVLCGGFPCQDISIAGKGAGIDGERSGLWREYRRAIGVLRPRYVVVENVANLLVRGLERVLGDLAALGYDAEWACLPALGLPHRRDRIWIVAYPAHHGRHDAEHGPRAGDPEGRLLASLSVAGSPALSPDEFRAEVRAAEFVRTANGIPHRVDRIHALGNAIVPRNALALFRAIEAAEGHRLTEALDDAA